MATAAGELQERTSFYRVFEKFRTDSISVVISSTSLVVTIAALLLAVIALSDAKEASIRSQMQTEQINALREEVAVLEVRVIRAERGE